ncbi:thioredoxin-like protein [Trichoderma ceciliae]
MAATSPKIKLYTNHMSPWAHRVHITLNELKVPFEEEIIDINTPRTPEYLKINPRGLVPSLSFNGEILTESAIIATFLADAFPTAGGNGVLPESTAPDGPLKRARISFFVDAYLNKVQPAFMKSNMAKTDEDRKNALADFIAVIAKELDPLLGDAAPFFGGSSKLTLAEVLTASFILRMYALCKHGLLPASLLDDLTAKAPNFDKWAQKVITHPSVLGTLNVDAWIAIMKQRMGGGKPKV